MHVAEAITLYPCYHVYGNRLEEFTKKIYYPVISYSARYQCKAIFYKRLETNIRVYEETVYNDN